MIWMIIAIIELVVIVGAILLNMKSLRGFSNVKKKYDVTLENIGAIGFSAMMHGYMAFDKDNPETWGKVSRNAPCPCGSGKKCKKCCRDKDIAAGLEV